MVYIPVGMLAFTFAFSEPNISPADKASEVIAQKLRMNNNYTVKIHFERDIPNAVPPHNTHLSYTLQIWRDGKKFRVDHFDAEYTHPHEDYVKGAREVTCENCEREGYGISTRILPGKPRILHLVQFRPLDHPLGFMRYCTHFDWRFLGLSNFSLCSYEKLKIATDFPAYFKKPEIVTTTEKRGDASCLVSRIKKELYDQTVWLSEKNGYHPVFFEETIRLKSGPESRTTEISWQKTKGGHLFPKVIKNKSIISIAPIKNKLACEEIYTITHADFDSPIDPAVFTIAGLGLNEGQAIDFPERDKKSGDYPHWRGGRIEYPEEKSPVKPKEKISPQ